MSLLYFFFFLSVCVFCWHIYIPCVCQEPMEPERASNFPGSRVSDGWDLPCGCWEPHLGPLEEQPEPLTAEASLQIPLLCF